jgi:hypothetical protein
MSDIKEKVRRLIDKAKESGDVDLLDLAMDLLDQVPVTVAETNQVSNREKEVPRDPVSGGEFRMNAETKNPKPLEVRQRENLYQDTGEHKDKNNKTPEIELTERRRPSFKKVEQTCQRCTKSVLVNPSFARDFFTCDSCLRR